MREFGAVVLVHLTVLYIKHRPDELYGLEMSTTTSDFGGDNRNL